MKYSLGTSIQFVKGVGPKIFQIFSDEGISKVEDLIYYFPFRYDDFSKVKKINELKLGEVATVYGVLKTVKAYKIGKKKLFVVEGLLTDESGSIRVIWFGQRYVTSFKDKEIIIAGKVVKNSFGLHLSPLQTQLKEKFNLHVARIVPVYRSIGNLKTKFIRKIIFEVLNNLNWSEVKEFLPDFIISKFNLISLSEAIKKIHFPESEEDISKSKKRFIFQDLLIFHLKILKEEKILEKKTAPQIKIFEEKTKEILDFDLTEDQKKAWEEIKKDLSQTKPMGRLLQGDVGTGKTILSQMAALNVALNGYQVVFMAPTEILAKQHFLNFLSRFSKFNLVIGFISSKETLFGFGNAWTKISRKKFLENVVMKKIDIIIGTHALIGEDIRFKKIGLIIVDEQQRFGVEQRVKLIEKADHPEIFPHFLSLTATPIPRTIALILYGNLDVSLLKQRPYPFLVKIFIIGPDQRKKVYSLVEKKLRDGFQLVVICPRVEEGKELKAVKSEYKKIKEIFKDFSVGILYGKMKTEEKENVIKDMVEGKIQILVSSSVLEVGINLPKLNLMIIENSERFGLAQLYQMIGRLSREGLESFAFLFVEKLTKSSYQRLKAIKTVNNGFELAEIDLKLRGPGEFFGKSQSGLPDIVIEGLNDKELMEAARKAALEILEKDSSLKSFPEFFEIFQKKGKILLG